MNCWGWATWIDRWKHFEKDPSRLVHEWTKDDIYRFNLENAHDFWGQVTANHVGKLNTWAIFWYATIFKYNGLCLNPSLSFVHNIGLDGSGENCGKSDNGDISLININENIVFPTDVLESDQAVQRIQQYYLKQKKTVVARAINRLARLAFGKSLL